MKAILSSQHLPNSQTPLTEAITLARANVKTTEMEMLKKKNEVLYEGKWE